MALLELEDVSKVFAQRSGKRDVLAVAGVSLSVGKGQTVGLVGESGCGKSTLARIALRLVDATSGRIRFDGLDITDFSGRRMRPVRRRLQAVFQDPLASLNARMTIEEILREPFDTHGIRLGPQLGPRIRELLVFWSAWRTSTSASCPASSLAGSCNASPSRGRWRSNRASSWQTNRRRRSIPRFRRRSST